MPQLTAYFTWLDYLVFAGYLALTAAIGTVFIKGQRNLDEYFLAGRSMGSVVVAMTILAALFSGISFLAAPSESFAHGPVFFLANLAFFVATPLTAMLLLPFFFNSKLFTAYQFLEERYSVQVRTLASASFIVRVLLWLAAATYAPALALEQVTGLPLWFTILCSGIVTTFYTTFGGMRAVIWTDVMQLVVLFGGQLVILGVAIARTPGGIAEVIAASERAGRFDVSLSVDPTVRITLWGLLIGMTFTHLVQMATDQVSVQRYLTAQNLRVAQRGLWLKLLMVLPVTAVFYASGVVLYAFYQAHGDPLASGRISKADQILPYFVINELPHGLPGLFTAAIFAASMSTISAGINSLTSATMVDFYQRLWRKPNLTEAHQLKMARILTIAYGSLVIALAFLVQRLGTLLEATNKVIGLVGGPLVGLFFLHVVVPSATARGALIGWMAGVAATLYVCFGTAVSFMWYTTTGALSTLTVAALVSWFDPARKEAGSPRSPSSPAVPSEGQIDPTGRIR